MLFARKKLRSEISQIKIAVFEYERIKNELKEEMLFLYKR